MRHELQHWVYRFDQIDLAEAACGGEWDAVRGLLGGKGANLGEMTRLGLPVPPGFTVSTEACGAYIRSGGTFPEGLWEQVIEALAEISVAARTLKRDQVPEDVVGAVVFLCAPGSEFVTGQTIVIDGGQYFH